ncbi:X-linked retinitis pigmentosa GTPase regulator isoform X2 [Polyergus mexicanus]|uniref:X-linked retinitis pigmentosa GTPase regulator isoform X2 n=1 Tax=Polyergus mexicanus TaxID=615972 RepID=UPI0038B50E35
MGLPDIETIPETGAVFTIGRSRFADNVASHFFIRKDPVVAIECGDEHSAVICLLKPEKVTHVACGRAHTLICTGAQKIFACGSNQEGQLGRENSAIGDSSSSPILIYDCGLAGSRIVQIAAGSHHSMVLTSDGGVVAWGSNLEGQLGLPGVSGLVNKPTKVPIPELVKEISAGYYHSAFLTESGLVYVCGESESGKLGIDVNFSTQVAPKQMQLPAPAVHVTCGGHHTLVLGENGNIYCSGSNASGQLGMGTNVNEIHMPKHLARGSLRNEKIVKIACGESHSAILTELGKLFTCGDGRHGKLGLEENENNVHQVTFAAKYQELFITNVACGGCHTILVGRRHEMDSQSQSDSTESATQNKSSLPPLKLPVNTYVHNEHRVDGATEKSKHEKDDSHHVDKINETPKYNNTETKSSKDSLKENSDIVNKEKISSSTSDEKIASPKKSKSPSKTNPPESSKKKVHTPKTNAKVEESQPTDKEDESKNKENAQNGENTEDKTDNESKDNVHENSERQKNNKNVEMTATAAKNVEESCTEAAASRTHEEKEQETSTNPTPPPKPPRLKSGSIENSSNENDPLRESKKNEHEKDKDEKDEHEKDECEKNKHEKDEYEKDEHEKNEREKDEHEKREHEKDEHEKDEHKKDKREKEKGEEETKTSNEPADSSPKSLGKSKSAISETITEKIVETIENTIEKVKEEVHGEESEKVETDGAQDDTDVIQSPAPRTAKVAKLFKGKRQEIENGNKTSSAANPKAKSKTCTVL